MNQPPFLYKFGIWFANNALKQVLCFNLILLCICWKWIFWWFVLRVWSNVFIVAGNCLLRLNYYFRVIVLCIDTLRYLINCYQRINEVTIGETCFWFSQTAIVLQLSLFCLTQEHFIEPASVPKLVTLSLET